MKIYLVEVSRYTYWKDACSSGFISEKHYFTNEDNANRFVANEQENPCWFNFKGKKVPIEAEYQTPRFKMETVETED